MNAEMWCRHPASVVLQWYAFAEKDEEEYARLSLLLECLEKQCGIKSRVFLQHISSKEWQENYGWRLHFHPWKPNRVKLIHSDDCKLGCGGCGKSPLHTLHFDSWKTRFNGRCEGSVPAVSFVRQAPTMSQPCESPEKGTELLHIGFSKDSEKRKLGRAQPSCRAPPFSVGWQRRL